MLPKPEKNLWLAIASCSRRCDSALWPQHGLAVADKLNTTHCCSFSASLVVVVKDCVGLRVVVVMYRV